MTRAVFYKNSQLGLGGFSINGHSGFDNSGKDILCAAVSSTAELVINLLKSSFNIDIIVSVNPKTAEVECVISNNLVNIQKKGIIFGILDGYYRYLLELCNEYPKNICCIITERKGYHD